jgi:predicted nucleotidyltransferase
METSIMTHTEKMSKEIKSEFDKCISYISQMDGVQQIYLFGSYAYGEPSAHSDIDMYIIVRDDVNTLKTMQNISLGLCDRGIALDVVADKDSDFKELSAPNRATLQRVVKDKGVLIYGQ